jgi:error-prone DNA polymerase
MLEKRTLLALARADALQSMGLTRREAIWKIGKLPERYFAMESLFATRANAQQSLAFPVMKKQVAMFQDYEHTGFSLRAHPIECVRRVLQGRGVSCIRDVLNNPTHFQSCTAAGLSTCKQRPGTAKGVVFITLEDETGFLNLIIRPQIFEEYQHVIIHSSSLLVRGTLQSSEGVTYLMPRSLISLDEIVLRELTNKDKKHTEHIDARRIPVRSYSY